MPRSTAEKRSDPSSKADALSTASFPVSDFHLAATLESGQVFGFSKLEDGSYRGSFKGRRLRLWQHSENLFFETNDSLSAAATETHLRHYFDLERDLHPLYALMEGDPKIPPSWKAIRGLRLIRQDPWEAMACFILSSNNNIKRIQQMWRRLAETLGRGGFHFPDAGAIAGSDETVLRGLGLGYRAPYLLKSARRVFEESDFLDNIASSPYLEAKARLMEFPGVASKVSDCILLYGFHKFEAFPVDVWIARILRKLYFRNRNLAEKKLLAFAQKRWGSLGGYLQQYLFHGARLGLL